MQPNRGLVVVQASAQKKRSNNCMRVFAGCNSRTSLFANRIRALRKQLQYCTGLRGTPPAAPAALRSLPSDLIRGSSSGEQRRKPLPRPEDPRLTLRSGQQKRSKQLHAHFRRVQFSDVTFRQPHQGLAKTIAVLHRFQGGAPKDGIHHGGTESTEVRIRTSLLLILCPPCLRGSFFWMRTVRRFVGPQITPATAGARPNGRGSSRQQATRFGC